MCGPNKLECLSLASLSGLVICLWEGQEPTLEWSPERCFTCVGSCLTFKHHICKGLQGTNTLAYYVTYDRKKFYNIDPRTTACRRVGIGGQAWLATLGTTTTPCLSTANPRTTGRTMTETTWRMRLGGGLTHSLTRGQCYNTFLLVIYKWA